MPKAAEVREDRVIQSASIGKDLKRSPESKTHLVQPSVWFLAPLGHPQRVLSSFRTCHDGTLLLPGKAMLPLALLKFFFFLSWSKSYLFVPPTLWSELHPLCPQRSLILTLPLVVLQVITEGSQISLSFSSISKLNP